MSAARGSPLLLALALGCVAPGGAPPAPRLPPLADAAGRPAVIVLVSVAGLTAERYLAGDAMPALAALASRGVAAEQLETVAGAGAYPAHASLVTGVAPAEHGIVADQLLGERGVRRAPPSHASQLRAATLWQRVAESGGSVTSLDWPTTTGAQIASLLPDVTPLRAGERWSALAAAGASVPWLADRLRAAPAAAEQPGPARDALLIDLACAAFEAPPRLLLLRLRGPEPPLVALGPYSAEAAAAFSAVDSELVRLLGCAERTGILPQTAFVVMGDQAFASVHTALRPNAWLREAGWITPQGRWKAFARSNGGSAYVYANEARTAVQVRKQLEARADESRAFRVVSADEMIERGADPDAWFGLEAEPGFVIENAADAAPFGAAAAHGSGGALRGEAGAGTGLVAFGRGFRRGVRVPRMSQLDVAPSVAALLGVPLEAATGRTLVGVLRLAPDPADAVAAPPAEATPRGR